jgi:hypothetical protein
MGPKIKPFSLTSSPAQLTPSRTFASSKYVDEPTMPRITFRPRERVPPRHQQPSEVGGEFPIVSSRGPTTELSELAMRIPRRFTRVRRHDGVQSVDTSRLRRCHPHASLTHLTPTSGCDSPRQRLPTIRTEPRAGHSPGSMPADSPSASRGRDDRCSNAGTRGASSQIGGGRSRPAPLLVLRQGGPGAAANGGCRATVILTVRKCQQFSIVHTFSAPNASDQDWMLLRMRPVADDRVDPSRHKVAVLEFALL